MVRNAVSALTFACASSTAMAAATERAQPPQAMSETWNFMKNPPDLRFRFLM
ncbi:hypothetical protein [Paracoccus alcaliphilus]|uniref:hypothetical protein n=1 Tax=Paracoccus alcaliphilus TaxID=34002 RepID=UPI001480E7FC|nr:hypothetical protein [Paracoccus alcaliphilus]WCR19605.1 hypothetical protein JHW40_08140 [Paracoccus alcaliphilus]